MQQDANRGVTLIRFRGNLESFPLFIIITLFKKSPKSTSTSDNYTH